MASERPDPSFREDYNIPFDSSVPPSLQNLAGSLLQYESDYELATLGGSLGGDDLERGESDGERDGRLRRSRYVRWGYWILLLTIFMSLTSVIQVFLAWRALSNTAGSA
jgi:hypothetical protein